MKRLSLWFILNAFWWNGVDLNVRASTIQKDGYKMIKWDKFEIRLLSNNTDYRIGDVVRTGYPFRSEFARHPDKYNPSIIRAYFSDPNLPDWRKAFITYCFQNYPVLYDENTLVIHLRLGDSYRALHHIDEIKFITSVAIEVYNAQSVVFVTALHFQGTHASLGPGLQYNASDGQISASLHVLDLYSEKIAPLRVKTVQSSSVDRDFCAVLTSPLSYCGQQSMGGIAFVTHGIRNYFRFRKVIAFSIFGGFIKRYHKNALANMKLARLIYPGWELRVYTDAPLPEWEKVGYRVVVVQNAHARCGGDLMRMRLLVATDPFVDAYLLRDADSLLSYRESAAVQEWLSSAYLYHSMHDHPSHACCPLMGGMWGGKMPIEGLTQIIALKLKGNDQTFLRKHVWPVIENSTLVHNAFGPGKPFPKARVGLEFIGAVSPGREFDTEILRRAMQV